MLKLWGRRNSFNVQKALWLIGELGLEYRHVAVGGAHGGLDAPEFLAMNPHGRIPVLQDDGLVVWESHAILRYLAARYGGGALWPDDPAARSFPDRWMEWAETTLQPDFLAVFVGYYRTPEAKRDWPAINAAIARCARHFELLDRVLARSPYLAGDEFTLGDIPAGATLYRYFNLDIERPRIPNVEAWRRRLEERPAYREHVMIPFEDLRG